MRIVFDDIHTSKIEKKKSVYTLLKIKLFFLFAWSDILEVDPLIHHSNIIRYRAIHRCILVKTSHQNTNGPRQLKNKFIKFQIF